MAVPYMTITEIEKEYPDQWVLIDRPTVGKGQSVTGGYVVLHCDDRVEFLRRFAEWDDPDSKHIATWYTGKGTVDELLPVGSEPGAA